MAKAQVEKRQPSGVLDYISLAITTFGVGYLPLAPGTWGSLVAVGFYAALASTFSSVRYTANPQSPESLVAAIHAIILVAFLLFILVGIWAATRSIELLGNSGSPREAAHRSRSAAYTHVSPLGQSIIGVLGGS